jgi:hypothetical protein
MSAWLNVAVAAAAVNLVLLGVLGAIWLRNYRQHRASHTLGFLVVAVFLLVQNALWVYFYGFHSEFIDWFVNAGTDVQIGMTFLCALETIALVVLFRITWQ